MRLPWEGLTNLLLAIECLTEVQNRSLTAESDNRLLRAIQNELECEGSETCFHIDRHYSFTHEAANILLGTMATAWRGNQSVLLWLKSSLFIKQESYVPAAAIRAMIKGWKEDPQTLHTLYEMIGQFKRNNSTSAKEYACIQGIAHGWKDDPNTLILLKSLAQNTKRPNLQQAALQELSRGWKEDKDTLHLLKTSAQSDNYFFGVRSEAITEIANGWVDEAWTFEFLVDRAIHDPFVRLHETNRNPRLIALHALLTHYPTHPKTLELLRDRAANDPDEQLRQWAEEQLKIQNVKLKTSQKC